ncbi:hypothetical protein GF312_01710 [Candidatus Poribacteria bacterium]|nr:hypothetical protein [Candidatus Poribacteria bacterium]
MFRKLVKIEKNTWNINSFIFFSIFLLLPATASAQRAVIVEQKEATEVKEIQVDKGETLEIENFIIKDEVPVEINNDAKYESIKSGQEAPPETSDGNLPPEEESPERSGGGPGEFRKMLEEEGLTPRDLRDNPELRKEIMKKMRQSMQNNDLTDDIPENEGREGEKRRRRDEGNDNQDPIKAYIDAVVNKNLFMPLGSGGEKRKTSFSLTAVIASSDPDTSEKAIIEEEGGRKSYYVTEGDKFAGNLEVINIEDEVVKFERDGNEEEIRLGVGTSGGGRRAGGGFNNRPQGRSDRGNRGGDSSRRDARRDDRDSFDASQIPPFARRMLEERGISIEELQNNPDLREKLRQEFETQIRNNPQMMREVSGRRNRRR